MTFTSAFHIAEPCSYYRNLAFCPNLLLLRETTCFRLMMNTLLFAFSPNFDWDAAVMRTTYQVGAAALRPRADLFYLRQMRVMFLPVLVLLCLRTSLLAQCGTWNGSFRFWAWARKPTAVCDWKWRAGRRYSTFILPLAPWREKDISNINNVSKFGHGLVGSGETL